MFARATEKQCVKRSRCLHLPHTNDLRGVSMFARATEKRVKWRNFAIDIEAVITVCFIFLVLWGFKD